MSVPASGSAAALSEAGVRLQLAASLSCTDWTPPLHSQGSCFGRLIDPCDFFQPASRPCHLETGGTLLVQTPLTASLGLRQPDWVYDGPPSMAQNIASNDLTCTMPGNAGAQSYARPPQSVGGSESNTGSLVVTAKPGSLVVTATLTEALQALPEQWQDFPGTAWLQVHCK